MQIDYCEIGSRIRAERLKKKITQEQLAAMVGTGTTHISHIETGNTVPSLKTFIAIVNALDASTDELLCDELSNSGIAYSKELSVILSDCTPAELRVINETVAALKKSMRKNKPTE